MDSIPDDLRISRKVYMQQPVMHSPHQMPGNLGMSCLNSLGDVVAASPMIMETIASLPGFGMAPVGHLSYRAAPNMRVGRTPPCAVQVHIDPILPKG